MPTTNWEKRTIADSAASQVTDGGPPKSGLIGGPNLLERRTGSGRRRCFFDRRVEGQGMESAHGPKRDDFEATRMGHPHKVNKQLGSCQGLPHRKTDKSRKRGPKQRPDFCDGGTFWHFEVCDLHFFPGSGILRQTVPTAPQLADSDDSDINDSFHLSFFLLFFFPLK